MAVTFLVVVAKHLTKATDRRKVILSWLDRIVHDDDKAWFGECEKMFFLFPVTIYVFETIPS